MTLRPKWAYFSAFTAVFAVLALMVFWGTWSLDLAPVMPDCNIVHAGRYSHRLAGWFAEWLKHGQFVPGDVALFVLSPYFWQELQYAFAAYCAALGMAYYLRGRSLSRVAAYGGGLLLAFCGYWFTLFSAGHLGWFVWMTYGVFAFGLVDRAVRGGKFRHWALLGACLAWASFRQADLWLLFTVFTALYFVWCCLRERKWPRWTGVLLAAAFFFAIGGPSFIGALFGTLAQRDRQIAEATAAAKAGDGAKAEAAGDAAAAAKAAEDRWIFVTNWSLPPEDTLEFFWPRVHGDTSCQITLALGQAQGKGVRPYTGRLGRPLNALEGNYRQHSLYVGFVTCLLALLAVVAAVAGFRRLKELPHGRSEVIFFAGAAAVFYLFSLGRFCEGVYRMVFALPFGDYLRAPVKWHHLTEFCLVVLAAFALEFLYRTLASVNRRTALGVVAAIAVVGAFDLARVDRLYCASVDLREARRTDAGMQLTVLPRAAFQHPQVQALRRENRLVSLANFNGNPDLFLVEMLTPREYRPVELPPVKPGVLAMGILSLLASFLALGWGVKRS